MSIYPNLMSIFVDTIKIIGTVNKTNNNFTKNKAARECLHLLIKNKNEDHSGHGPVHF